MNQSAASVALPTITSPLPPAEAIARLDRLSKRGKLPGFEKIPGGGGGFTCDIFGAPFDRELVAQVVTTSSGGCEINAQSRLRLKLPLIYAAVLIVTVWPGVWLTDSMLKIYFSWYTIETWWWYMPMCLLMIPAVRKQWKTSQAVAAEETAELLKKIAGEVEGSLSA
jgi:hypothetical protein